MSDRAKILIIDDLRQHLPHLAQAWDQDFPDGWDIYYARTSKQALRLIDACAWNQVWLDFDLGLRADGTQDDTDCISYVLEEAAVTGTCLPIKTIYIHTDNSVGRERLNRALSKHYNVQNVDARHLFRSS